MKLCFDGNGVVLMRIRVSSKGILWKRLESQVIQKAMRIRLIYKHGVTLTMTVQTKPRIFLIIRCHRET